MALSKYSPAKACLPRNNQYLRSAVFCRNQLKSSVKVAVSYYPLFQTKTNKFGLSTCYSVSHEPNVTFEFLKKSIKVNFFAKSAFTA